MSAAALKLMKIPRNPAEDPQIGDVLRDVHETFPRRILKRETARVLVERGVHNHGWQKLENWQKWAARKSVRIVSRDTPRPPLDRFRWKMFQTKS